MSDSSYESRNSSISSSVIQRSFIPEGLNVVLNIATAPLSELGIEEEREPELIVLKALTAEILGIPKQSLLDETQYQNIGKSLASGDFWDYMYRRFPYPPYLYDFYRYTARTISERMQERQESTETAFVKDALSLMANPIPQAQQPLSLLLSENLIVNRGQLPDEFEGVSVEALQLGLACVFSGINPDERVVRFRNDVQAYDIPSGQSPATKSDSLLKLIETSKKVCLAPLAAGGTVGVTQLTQGALVQALLCTGTGAAMTLILIGTVSVADLLVRYLLQKRPHKDTSSQGAAAAS